MGSGFRKQLACQKLSPRLNQTKRSEIACLVKIKWTHGVILMIPNIVSYLHLSDSCPFAGGFWDQGGHLELVVLARQRAQADFKVPCDRPGGSLPVFLTVTDGSEATSWNLIMKFLTFKKANL